MLVALSKVSLYRLDMGSLFAVIACLVQTLKDSVSKKIALSVDGLVSSVASFAYALPYYFVLLPLLYFLGLEDFVFSEGFWLFVILRALTDSLAETFKMYAFNFGTLSAVSALMVISKIMTVFLSPIITGDPFSMNTLWGVLLTILGGYIIVFQKTEKVNIKCIIFALLASFFFTLNVCLDRLAVQTASAVFSAFIMTSLAGLILAPFAVFNRQRRSELLANKKIFCLRGFFEMLFMIAKFMALQHITAPQWGAISRLTLLFSVFSGGVYFKEKNIVRKIIGALITIAGVLLALK